jgi:hypothetical protein
MAFDTARCEQAVGPCESYSDVILRLIEEMSLADDG